MRRRLGQSVRNATNTHDCVFIFLAIGYRDSRADRESVTFFAASFRSRTDRTADEATGVVPIKNPGAGRTSAPRDDPQVWREEHEQITIRVDPDLLAAISERQSMAIVKQPRRTFVGQRQAEAFIAPAKPAPDENMKQITIRVDPDQSYDGGCHRKEWGNRRCRGR